MANASFGVNILPKNNTVTIGNSESPWTVVSPNMTGVPVAPTAADGTSTTQVATTEFVQNAIDSIEGNTFFTTVGFSIQTTDWSATAPYTYTFTSNLIGDNTTIDVYPDVYSNPNAYPTEDWNKVQRGIGPAMKWEKVSGGVRFTIAAIPSDTITGTIRVIGSSSNNSYVKVQETTMPISKGGTGAANAAGALVNLGIGNVENKTSAMIRDELTAANVASALGYTPVSTDTKNTAGAAEAQDKIYLIGAEEQTANPQTYSKSNVYVSAAGKLTYDDSEVVNLNKTQTLQNKRFAGQIYAYANLDGTGGVAVLTRGTTWGDIKGV